jgi:hypothetical protein
MAGAHVVTNDGSGKKTMRCRFCNDEISIDTLVCINCGEFYEKELPEDPPKEVRVVPMHEVWDKFLEIGDSSLKSGCGCLMLGLVFLFFGAIVKCL